MSQLKHRAFLHQANGIVFVTDGTTEAAFGTLAEFQAVEPSYQPGVGVVALGYEVRGEAVLFHRQMADGSIENLNVADAAIEALIDKVDDYAEAVAERAHPLYGVTDLTEARTIVGNLVAAEFERRANAAFAPWSPAERVTFERQLAEAIAWDENQAAPTVLLDAIRLPGETKAAQVANILALSEQFTLTVGALMLAKRTHTSTVWNDLDTVEDLAAHDVTAGWPSLPSLD